MSEQEKKKGMSKGLKLGLLVGGVIIIFIIGSLSLRATKTPASTPSTFQKTITASPTPTAIPTPKFIFDVPSLIGKNIDEIRTILGEPIDGELTEPNQQQIELGMTQWDNIFNKNEYQLQISFNATSRKVIDFFVNPLSGYVDQNKLMEISNTKENASNYTIKAVKELKNPNNITGITITPK